MLKFKKSIYRTSNGLDVFTAQWLPTGQYCIQDSGGGSPAVPVIGYDLTASTEANNNGFSLYDITATTYLVDSIQNANGVLNLISGHQYQVSTHANSGTALETAHCDISVDITDVVTSVTTHLYDETHTGTLTNLISQYTFTAADNKVYTVTGSSFVGET